MIRIIFILILLNCGIRGFSQDNKPTIIKFETLDNLMKQDGKIRVFNFWATWCAPCVNELPYFELAKEFYSEKEIEIVLVSLDFADQVDKVEKFMVRKKIKNRVVLLDEIDYNSWIDKVSKDWSGAIPTTLLIDRNNNKHLREGEMSQEELDDLINEHIN